LCFWIDLVERQDRYGMKEMTKTYTWVDELNKLIQFHLGNVDFVLRCLCCKAIDNW